MKMKDFGFYRGVNLGGWMSQCDYSQDRLNHFITEKDFDVIAGWGLDHVRLPLDYNVLENGSGSFSDEGFERVRKAVSWATSRKLNIVLDLHKTAGYSFDGDEKEEGFFDSESYQERFYRLWEAMAEAFYDPAHVAFELLNEVTDESFIQAWNRISGTCIGKIRKKAPDSLILVGSYHNNSAHAVKDLAAPADDKVIYNFHCYDPLEFTHQGAFWVPQLDQAARPNFAESGITPEFFEKDFESAIRAAEENHTCLYCGEYGVIEQATPEDTVRWYRTIHEVLEKHQIGRSAWSYREMNFGLSDARLDGVRDELIRYL